MSRKPRGRRKSISEVINQCVALVEPYVEFCPYCDLHDESRHVLSWLDWEEREIEGLLEEFDVPNELRDRVAARLSCANCPRRGFVRHDKFRQRTAAQQEKDRRLGQWFKLLEQWQLEYEKDVRDFAGFLELYPYLGFAHPIGKLIDELLPSSPRLVSPESRGGGRGRPSEPLDSRSKT